MKKSLLTAIKLILFVAMVGSANALVINLDATDYSLGSCYGSFLYCEEKFKLTESDWWGDADLASDLIFELNVLQEFEVSQTNYSSFAYGQHVESWPNRDIRYIDTRTLFEVNNGWNVDAGEFPDRDSYVGFADYYYGGVFEWSDTTSGMRYMYQISVIEPSTFALMGVCILGLLLSQRRSKYVV